LKPFHFILGLAMLATLYACATPGHKPNPNDPPPSFGGLCPLETNPTLQQAQLKVLDLENKLAEAQHDLDSIQLINERVDLQNNLLQAQNRQDAQAVLQIQDWLQKVSLELTLVDQRLTCRHRWVDAIHAGNCWDAQTALEDLKSLQ
jgi:hypothetical protein